MTNCASCSVRPRETSLFHLEADGQRYLIDANTLMRIDELGVPEDRRNAVWSDLLALVEAGRAFTVWAVVAEVKRNSSTTYQKVRRLRERKSTFVLTRQRQLADGDTTMVNALCAEYPALCGQQGSRRDKADPWLIAAAHRLGLVLVTQEPNRQNKIPQVCKELHVKCIALDELIVAEHLGSPADPG